LSRALLLSRVVHAARAARDANVAARTYIDVRRRQAVDDYLALGDLLVSRT